MWTNNILPCDNRQHETTKKSTIHNEGKASIQKEKEGWKLDSDQQEVLSVDWKKWSRTININIQSWLSLTVRNYDHIHAWGEKAILQPLLLV